MLCSSWLLNDFTLAAAADLCPQVAFRRVLGKGWQAYVAPLGGRGDEAAVTLNAQAGTPDVAM